MMYYLNTHQQQQQSATQAEQQPKPVQRRAHPWPFMSTQFKETTNVRRISFKDPKH